MGTRSAPEQLDRSTAGPDSTTPAAPPRWRSFAIVATLLVALVGSVVLAAKADDPDPPDDAVAAPAASTTTSSTAPASTTTTAAPTSTTTVTGEFQRASGSGPVHGTGPVTTYVTEVEVGSGVDPEAFAATVDAILADPRGWTGAGGYAFQRVESGGAITISLATPATTDQICLPLQTNGIFSCREGARAIINLRRWNEGTTDLPLSVDDYRAEVINHEVGHTLGKGHVGCGGPGLRAPVMMQQSKGLDGCVANPWPALDGT